MSPGPSQAVPSSGIVILFVSALPSLLSSAVKPSLSDTSQSSVLVLPSSMSVYFPVLFDS